MVPGTHFSFLCLTSIKYTRFHLFNLPENTRETKSKEQTNCSTNLTFFFSIGLIFQSC